MSGFSNIQGDETIVFADNASFDGTARGGKITTDGQLWIGSSTSPHVRAGALASSGGSVAITTGHGTINLETVTGTSKFPVTPFVVGPVGQAGYQTIQSALDAANSAGGGAVWVQPGTYTENLTLYGVTQIVGATGNSDVSTIGSDVTIIGTHVPPATGWFSFRDVFLQSATDILSSAVAGSAFVVLENCNVQCTNGYTFNMVNWTGAMAKFNVQDNSTINGIVNNTGGGVVFIQDSNSGAGSANPMITSGTVVLKSSDMVCPWTAGTGTTIQSDNGIHENIITLNGNAQGTFSNCRFSTGGSPALTMSSTTSSQLLDCIIDSSNNPAITGAGAGTLTINDCTFVNNSTIANTLTIATTGGTYPAGSLGSAGNVWTSNGPGAVPTFQAASALIAITPLTHAATPYTVLSTDYFIAIIGSVGTFTAKLPNAPATGKVYVIKDSNGSAASFNIAVTTVGGTVTIDGQTTYTMATNYQSISVIFDGTNYEVF